MSRDLKSISWVIWFFTVLFLAVIVSQIPDEKIQFKVMTILICILPIAMMYTCYKDFNDKNYSITIFIVLTDIVIIILYIAYIFILFKYYEVRDVRILKNVEKTHFIIRTFLYTGLLLRCFLKSKRFLKKCS